MLLAREATENVAIFSMLGVILAAVFGTTVPALIANRRQKTTNDALGVVNGQGTAMQMLGKILDRQGNTDTRLARLEERQAEVTINLAHLAGRLTSLEAPKVSQTFTTHPPPEPPSGS